MEGMYTVRAVSLIVSRKRSTATELPTLTKGPADDSKVFGKAKATGRVTAVHIRRFLAHGFLAIYVILTFFAFCFTMFRWKPLGFTIIFPSYGMMAPYQGYAREHRELIAQGRKNDGSIERINMLSYYPGRRGEGVVRQQMRALEWFRGTGALLASYKHLATQIQEHERAQGRDYISVSLAWEVWPPSLEDYEKFRHPPFTRIFPVVIVP